jgi:hypothetical protein
MHDLTIAYDWMLDIETMFSISFQHKTRLIFFFFGLGYGCKFGQLVFGKFSEIQFYN